MARVPRSEPDGAARTAPLVSVIVPVHNGARTLEPLLRSLCGQAYPRDAYEVIVVDNLSSDRTPEIAAAFPVRLMQQRDKASSYASRNAGLDAANGSILAFVDADCEVPRDWLAQSVRRLEEQPAWGCLAGEVLGAAPSREIERYLCERKTLSQTATLTHPFLPYPQTAAVVYRRGVFERIGRFEEWYSAGDADLAWRMQLETPFVVGFDASVVVRHRHRATLGGFLKQRFKWGYGCATLYGKYRGRIPYDRRRGLWRVRRLLWEAARLLWRWPAAGRDPARRYACYDVLAQAATTLGQAYGSLKSRVWYVGA